MIGPLNQIIKCYLIQQPKLSLTGMLRRYAMMSIALLVILLLTARLANAQTSTAIWTTQCGFDSQAVASQALAIYQNSCENVQNGGGGTFNGSVYSELTGLDTSGNNIYNYCVKLACDLCTSADINAIENYYKDSCEAVCQDSKSYYCHAGGYGDRPDVQFSGCGLPITTGECAESSSSIESSSSGESSSSVASSSSVEGSSSASEPTSSTSVHSSSSIAGNGALADICNANCLGPHDHILFSTIPKMDGIPSYSSYSCYDGLLLLKTNISRIAVSWSYCSHDDQCSTYDRLTVYWCNYGDSLTSVGCAPFSGGTYFLCDSATCYYSFQDTLAAESYVLPSNISVSQIYSLADSAARLAGYSDRAAYANYGNYIFKFLTL